LITIRSIVWWDKNVKTTFQEGVFIAENLIPEAREAIKGTPIFDRFCTILDIKTVIFY